MQGLVEGKMEFRGQSERMFLEKRGTNAIQEALNEVHCRKAKVAWKHRFQIFSTIHSMNIYYRPSKVPQAWNTTLDNTDMVPALTELRV